MAQYRFIALSNAVEGREDEFNDWYDNRHIHDVLTIPGFKQAQRGVWDSEILANGQAPTHRHIAIYEFESDNLAETLGHFFTRAGTEQMPISDAMATDAMPAIYRVTGPVVKATDA